MRSRTRLLAGLSLVAASAGVGFALWGRLPAEMATHWDATGTPDDTMAKPYALTVLPAVTLVALVSLEVAPRVDPERASYEAFGAVYDWFVLGLVAFLSYVHLLVVGWNLGLRFPLLTALAPALAALYYGVGVLLERAQQNWFVGIRTPWTLSDETVWERTHDRAAPLFKVAAVLALGGLLVPRYALAFVVAPVVAAGGYAVVYSFLAYRRRHGAESAP